MVAGAGSVKSSAGTYTACTEVIEPLIGPIENLDLTNINWVIVGGESGPKARLMKEEWVVKIKDECKRAKAPFFFKQWGGVNKKKNGRELKGRTWDEMPKLRKVV